MWSNDRLKGIEIKSRTYYYFDDIISISDLHVDNNEMKIDEKSYKNYSIHNVAHKMPHGGKLLYITFDKVGRCIRKYDKTRYLSLFHSDKNMEVFFLE